MSYVEPTPADMKARYPAFATVEDATIAYWLTDAHRFVDQTWREGDYGPALIAAAAHHMSMAGVAGLSAGEVSGLAAAGVESFRSGSFSASFSGEAVARASAGGWDATGYGQEYAALLATNKGGPRVTVAGGIGCCDGFNGYAGGLPYPARFFSC